MAGHAFRGEDFFSLDDLLSDEERAVRDAARAFVSDKIIPIVEKHHRNATFPTELIPQFGEMGFLGANLHGYDCAGVNNVAYGLIMQELERGDSGVRSYCSVKGGLVMYPIFSFGSEKQKDHWLPLLAKGQKTGCFGLSEPDHGSDPAGMETKAELKGDTWTLNGAKRWITNGTIADVAVVWARTKEGIRGFLVEKGMKGYSAPPIEGKFSLRASVTSELVFEDVKLPKDAVLPKADGLKAPLMCLTQARYGIAWGAVGSMMAVLDEAVHYTKSRVQFGKPIASFQLVQEKLVEMHTMLTHAQLTCLRMGRMKDENKLKPHHVSFGKRNNVRSAREVAKLGRELLGANGICDEYQVGRHMCNMESVYTYEGTHEIHTLVLGEHLTGIAAYK
ncbi:acyl-CoA dehydrogenase family protein [bacterium]|nr:acyl-CoA dehydrogenase family protein [bacterium]